jgi:hypothetical protein
MMAHLRTCLQIIGAIVVGTGFLCICWFVILWVTKG